MIVLGLVIVFTNLRQLFCIDYCSSEQIQQVNTANSIHLFLRGLGFTVSLAGFAFLLVRLPSPKLRAFPIILALAATVGSGLITFRQSIFTSSNSFLSTTETSGLPFVYRTTSCINAPQSYCPTGVYTVISWTIFLFDLMFYLTIGYIIALRYSGYINLDNDDVISAIRSQESQPIQILGD